MSLSVPFTQPQLDNPVLSPLTIDPYGLQVKGVEPLQQGCPFPASPPSPFPPALDMPNRTIRHPADRKDCPSFSSSRSYLVAIHPSHAGKGRWMASLGITKPVQSHAAHISVLCFRGSWLQVRALTINFSTYPSPNLRSSWVAFLTDTGGCPTPHNPAERPSVAELGLEMKGLCSLHS